MTQSEFFSGVEKNLLRLTESRIALPDYNLPGVFRGDGYQQMLRKVMKIKTLKKITEKDPSAPANVRVYDLVSGAVPGGAKLKFRIFAAFVEDPSREAYKEVKFRIRKWYQESGWADASDKPYAGAMVIGAAKSWPEGMAPNADDIPFAQVAFQVLSAPCIDPKLGIEMATSGDEGAGALIFRALGEDFESRKRRVAEYVEGLFRLPERAREGHVFVEDVAEKTRISEGDVANIFNDLQGEGKLTIRKTNARRGCSARSKAASMYVLPGPAPIWRQIVSKHQGAWYTKSSFCAVVSISTIAFLLRLVLGPLKGLISDFISGDSAILIYVIGALAVVGCLLFIIKLMLRNR